MLLRRLLHSTLRPEAILSASSALSENKGSLKSNGIEDLYLKTLINLRSIFERQSLITFDYRETSTIPAFLIPIHGASGSPVVVKAFNHGRKGHEFDPSN
ncbi:hypothetical protein TNCV_3451391 [Trichonephila clavipes]|uniref:Uncharacterized protein n=1 Tax=Trichonephila clavipes TaxID=2585209 RepID=A0A8X7BM95_TRICX|nr:hypothetical protein TNCV_3451391 [Trichonephila clavipes]